MGRVILSYVNYNTLMKCVRKLKKCSSFTKENHIKFGTNKNNIKLKTARKIIKFSLVD